MLEKTWDVIIKLKSVISKGFGSVVKEDTKAFCWRSDSKAALTRNFGRLFF